MFILNLSRNGLRKEYHAACYGHASVPQTLRCNISRTALIDWYGCRAESALQKRPDLARRVAASATAPGWAAKLPSCRSRSVIDFF